MRITSCGGSFNAGARRILSRMPGLDARVPRARSSRRESCIWLGSVAERLFAQVPFDFGQGSGFE